MKYRIFDTVYTAETLQELYIKLKHDLVFLKKGTPDETIMKKISDRIIRYDAIEINYKDVDNFMKELMDFGYIEKIIVN